MTTRPPRLAGDALSDLVRRVWGLETSVEELGGWEDDNFRLRTDDGRSFVLKIAPDTVDRATLANQAALLDHLAASTLAPLAPRVVPTRTGGPLHRIEASAGTRRWARLLTYLAGQPLAGVVDRPPGLLDAIGRRLAELDLVLGSFDHPGTRRTHEWDVMAAPKLTHMTVDIRSADRRTLVTDCLDRFAATVTPRRDELAHGVIHADANDHNLLLTHVDGRPRLNGIIDFGDALWAPVVVELAVCLAYLMLDREDPLADAGAVVRGYHDVRPLTVLERRLLPDLVLGRVCSSVLHAAHGSVSDPDNDYLQISAAPMWRLLAWFTSHRDDVSRTVEAACS